MWRRPSNSALFVLLAVTQATVPLARAEIVRYVDSKGTVHFIQKKSPAQKKPARQTGPLTAAMLSREKRLQPVIEKIARRVGVDPVLVCAVIRVESAFNSQAVSSAGAQGLMQLMPDTAKRFGVDDVFDIEQNIRGGTLYLRFLLKRYKNRLSLTLAAYHAGEGRVDRAGGIPAIPATQSYVVDVIRHYKERGGKYRLVRTAQDSEEPSRPARVYRDKLGRLVVTNVP